jgi:putative ABC transport system permease protein
LILVEIGLLLGLMSNAVAVLEHAGADLWVMPRSVPNFDFSRPLLKRRLCKVQSLPGVKRAACLTNFYTLCRTGNGGTLNIMLLGGWSRTRFWADHG